MIMRRRRTEHADRLHAEPAPRALRRRPCDAAALVSARSRAPHRHEVRLPGRARPGPYGRTRRRTPRTDRPSTPTSLWLGARDPAVNGENASEDADAPVAS